MPAALFERPHSVLLLNTGHVCVPTPGPEFWGGGVVCKSWYLAHVRQTVPTMVAASLSGWTLSLIWNPLKAVWGWRRREKNIGSQAADGALSRGQWNLCFPVGHGVNAEWRTAVCLGPSFPLPAPCSPTGVCRVMKCETGSPGGPEVGVAGVLWD